ncbi:hypothetical protein EYZ11_011926 [Aspergillus tanneri]|uniref:Uncharacterized protein n=1 Tax=Aspergillus tanneri TaxID=1220188 RepID=A0A4S3J1I8_9EURO|nr:hypothetical protein EYZ11_011926 [Aspergillus tanneri]
MAYPKAEIPKCNQKCMYFRDIRLPHPNSNVFAIPIHDIPSCRELLGVTALYDLTI